MTISDILNFKLYISKTYFEMSCKGYLIVVKPTNNYIKLYKKQEEWGLNSYKFLYTREVYDSK